MKQREIDTGWIVAAGEQVPGGIDGWGGNSLTPLRRTAPP